MEDSALGGKLGMEGKGRGMKVMRGERWGGIWGRRRRFPAVEMKEMRWPLVAKLVERWRNGMR